MQDIEPARRKQPVGKLRAERRRVRRRALDAIPVEPRAVERGDDCLDRDARRRGLRVDADGHLAAALDAREERPLRVRAGRRARIGEERDALPHRRVRRARLDGERALADGRQQELLRFAGQKLDANQQQTLKQLLQDKDAMQKLLQSEQAQKLMQRLKNRP